MTIRGNCWTNLDSHKQEQWPTEFVAVPRAGERVQAVSGKNLAVIQVTHGLARDGKPTIFVELHLNHHHHGR